MVAKKTISLFRGDDEYFSLLPQIKNKQGDIFPFPLESIKRIDLHARENGHNALALSTEDGTIAITESGKILLSFSHNLTANAEWQVADYDLQITYKSGQIKTILCGQIKLTHDITRVGNE